MALIVPSYAAMTLRLSRSMRRSRDMDLSDLKSPTARRSFGKMGATLCGTGNKSSMSDPCISHVMIDTHTQPPESATASR